MIPIQVRATEKQHTHLDENILINFIVKNDEIIVQRYIVTVKNP